MDKLILTLIGVILAATTKIAFEKTKKFDHLENSLYIILIGITFLMFMWNFTIFFFWFNINAYVNPTEYSKASAVMQKFTFTLKWHLIILGIFLYFGILKIIRIQLQTKKKSIIF